MFYYCFKITQALGTGIQNVVINQYGDVPDFYRETAVIDYIQTRVCPQ